MNALLDGDEAMGNVVVDSIRSKNIFDEIWINGTINSGNGSVDSTYSSYSITNVNLIPVKPNTQYVISFSGGNYVINRIATFNSSGTFISRSASLNTTTFTTDSNTYFIRFNIWDDNGMSISSVGNTQIEKGSTATSYAPYQELDFNNTPLGTITNAYGELEIASYTEVEVKTIELQAGHTYIVTASADVNTTLNTIMNLQMYVKSGTASAAYIPRNCRTTGQAGGGLCITGFIECNTNCVIGCSCYNYDTSSHTFRCYIGAIQLK